MAMARNWLPIILMASGKFWRAPKRYPLFARRELRDPDDEEAIEQKIVQEPVNYEPICLDWLIFMYSVLTGYGPR